MTITASAEVTSLHTHIQRKHPHCKVSSTTLLRLLPCSHFLIFLLTHSFTENSCFLTNLASSGTSAYLNSNRTMTSREIITMANVLENLLHAVPVLPRPVFPTTLKPVLVVLVLLVRGPHSEYPGVRSSWWLFQIF